MRPSASLVVLAAALSGFSGVSGAAIPPPNEIGRYRIGVPMKPENLAGDKTGKLSFTF